MSTRRGKAGVLLPLNFLRTEGLFSQISQIGRFVFPSAFPCAHLGDRWGISNTWNSSSRAHKFLPVNLWGPWDHFIPLFLFAGEEVMKYGNGWILPSLDKSLALLTLRLPPLPPYSSCCLPCSWLEWILLGAFSDASRQPGLIREPGSCVVFSVHGILCRPKDFP